VDFALSPDFTFQLHNSILFMPPKETTKGAPHTTPGQRLLIIQWLKIPANFALITGGASVGKAVVAGTKLKKKDAYVSLAKYITENSEHPWDHSVAMNRYNGIVEKYKKAKAVCTRSQSLTPATNWLWLYRRGNCQRDRYRRKEVGKDVSVL
jgi:hypothetical protein